MVLFDPEKVSVLPLSLNVVDVGLALLPKVTIPPPPAIMLLFVNLVLTLSVRLWPELPLTAVALVAPPKVRTSLELSEMETLPVVF